MPATASEEFRRAESTKAASPAKKPDDDVDRDQDAVDAGRRAAPLRALPPARHRRARTVARVAQHDVAEDGGHGEMMITGTGTRPTRPLPNQRIEASKPEIGPPFEMVSVRPRKMVRPPSVTTKGGTLSRVIACPWMKPASAPTATAAGVPRTSRSQCRPPPRATACWPCRPWPPPPRPCRRAPAASRPKVDAGGEDDEGHAERDQAR